MSGNADFDSEEHAEDEAFQVYRSLYSIGAEVFRTGAPFRARVRSLNLDGAILYERELNGVAHCRRKLAGRDEFRHFALHVVLAGELHACEESGYAVAKAGDLVIADTTRPSRTQAVDLHMLSASIPRSAMVIASGGSDRFHGRIATAPTTHTLRDFLASCMANGEAIPLHARPAAVRALIELLSVALGERQVAGAAEQHRREMLQREAAIRFIRKHLADRALDAGVLAEAIGVSRRSLYRLLAPYGGVSHLIMECRLAAVRDALEAGSTAPIASLAADHGFSDDSHLSRRFAQRCGETIGVYRQRLLQEGHESRRARNLARWVDALR